MKTFKVLSVFSLMIFLMAFVPKTFNRLPTTSVGYQIGALVPDFTLTNVDEHQVSLSDYKNASAVVVVFMAHSCPYTRAYEDRIIAIQKEYEDQNVRVVAINPNKSGVIANEDSFNNMQKRAQYKNYAFPFLWDENQKIYQQFGVKKTPSVYLLLPTSEGFRLQYKGAIDDSPLMSADVENSYLTTAIEAMLRNQNVKLTDTNVVGCSIKD